MKVVAKKIPQALYRKIHQLLPIVCVDLVVIDGRGHFLLVKRKNKPEAGLWWFVGGRIFKNETLKKAVLRKLKQETDLRGTIQKQLGVYEYFSKAGYFKGTNAHAIAIVFLVKADIKDEVILDWQSSDSQWFRHIGRNWHPYLKQYLKLVGFTQRRKK